MKRLPDFVMFLCALCVATASYADTYAPGACSAVPGSKSCVDATPCKTMSDGSTVCLSGVAAPADALSLTQTCWKYAYQYACQGSVPINTCTDYEKNPACGVVSSVCTDTLAETGACDSWNYTYQCLTKSASTTDKLVCSDTKLFDTSTLPTPTNDNKSLITAALALEIGRETQVYGEGGKNPVFSGVAESCTKGYGGLKNCCNAAPGAKSNNSFVSTIAGSAAVAAVKYAGENAVDVVSPYVFDAMYSSGLFSDGLMASITSSTGVIATWAEGSEAPTAIGTNFASNGPSISAFGFTYGTGTFEGAGLSSSTMDLSSSFGLAADGTEGFIAFDPYMLAAQLVIMAVMKMMSCTQDEQMLAMHKGANLSVYINETCKSKFLGSCTQYEDHYCSFNSVLAKIINIQGKKQLGLDWKDCTGLAVDQVHQLNFSSMDFSEFTATMVQQAQAGLPTNVKGNYTPVMQTKPKGSSQAPGAGMAYPPGVHP